jgi:hypothetical protein
VSDLAYFDVKPILAKLADMGREFVLIGGQAVNFWATMYESRVPELQQEGPFTSKDIDFCGDRASVQISASRLGGRAHLPDLDDATPNAGTVEFVDADDVTRILDVVTAPFGLNAADVHETALSVELDEEEGEEEEGGGAARFFVMHPVLSMESRFHNVAGLAARYDNDHGRKQLRASIHSVREFLRDVLEGKMGAQHPVREVLKMNERIFRFCQRDLHAKQLYRTHGIDPAGAMLEHLSLPELFRTRRLPQMRADLAGRKREASEPRSP